MVDGKKRKKQMLAIAFLIVLAVWFACYVHWFLTGENSFYASSVRNKDLQVFRGFVSAAYRAMHDSTRQNNTTEKELKEDAIYVFLISGDQVTVTAGRGDILSGALDVETVRKWFMELTGLDKKDLKDYEFSSVLFRKKMDHVTVTADAVAGKFELKIYSKKGQVLWEEVYAFGEDEKETVRVAE